MKLYALDNERCLKPSCHKTHGYDDNGYCRHWNVVEPCEHGKIDRHYLTQYEGQGIHRDDMKWCGGAGLENGIE